MNRILLASFKYILLSTILLGLEPKIGLVAQSPVQVHPSLITEEEILKEIESLQKARDNHRSLVQNELDEATRRSAVEQFMGRWQIAAEKMHAIFETQPSSKVAEHARLWIISNTDSDYTLHEKATESVLVYSSIGSLVGLEQNLVGLHPVYEIALRKLIDYEGEFKKDVDDSKSRIARANAIFQLASLLVQRAGFREKLTIGLKCPVFLSSCYES